MGTEGSYFNCGRLALVELRTVTIGSGGEDVSNFAIFDDVVVSSSMATAISRRLFPEEVTALGTGIEATAAMFVCQQLTAIEGG